VGKQSSGPRGSAGDIANYLRNYSHGIGDRRGAWLAYSKFVDDKEKGSNVRIRELTERNTNQSLRSSQLSSYPTDRKQTISVAFFLFQDLRELIENGSKRKIESATGFRWNSYVPTHSIR